MHHHSFINKTSSNENKLKLYEHGTSSLLASLLVACFSFQLRGSYERNLIANFLSPNGNMHFLLSTKHTILISLSSFVLLIIVFGILAVIDGVKESIVTKTMHATLPSGNMSVLIWACSRQMMLLPAWPYDGGHLPAAWDKRTCANAARNGHLNVLQWFCSQDPLHHWMSGHVILLLTTAIWMCYTAGVVQ
jgi:hypothetical protein